MDFLKELFNGGAMTYDQLEAAVKSKGFSIVDTTPPMRKSLGSKARTKTLWQRKTADLP